MEESKKSETKNQSRFSWLLPGILKLFGIHRVDNSVQQQVSQSNEEASPPQEAAIDDNISAASPPSPSEEVLPEPSSTAMADINYDTIRRSLRVRKLPAELPQDEPVPKRSKLVVEHQNQPRQKLRHSKLRQQKRIHRMKKLHSPRSRKTVFKCPVCHTTFNKPNAYSHHMHSHNKNAYRCTRCFFRAPTIDRMRKHLKSNHENYTPFKCLAKCTTRGIAFCTESFQTPAELRGHLFLEHTSERPWICPHSGCGKVSSHPGNLRRHVQLVKHSDQNQNCYTYKNARALAKRLSEKFLKKAKEQVHSENGDLYINVVECVLRRSNLLQHFRRAQEKEQHMYLKGARRVHLLDPMDIECQTHPRAGPSRVIASPAALAPSPPPKRGRGRPRKGNTKN